MKLKSREEIRQIIDEAKDEVRTLLYSNVIKMMLPNIKKSLDKAGTQAITPFKQFFKVSLSYVFFPVLLVLLKDYIGWQIVIIVAMVFIYSARFWLFSFSVDIQGKILGGRHAIANPPSLGETYIELVDHEGIQIWKSEEIVFNPNKNLDKKGKPLTVAAMPFSGHHFRTPIQRIKIYKEYLRMREDGRTNVYDLLAARHRLDSRTIKAYVEECSHLTDIDEYLKSNQQGE